MRNQIRILTGRHAGACVPLIKERYTVGNSEDSDLFISDWSDPTLIIEVDHDANVHYMFPNASAEKKKLLPWKAQQFGPIVLCIGPSDSPWPDVLTLLQPLLSVTQLRLEQEDLKLQDDLFDLPQLHKSKRKYWKPALASVFVAACCISLYFGINNSVDNVNSSQKLSIQTEAPGAMLRRLHEQLVASGNPDLHVSLNDNTLSIDGIVKNYQAYETVENLLSAYPWSKKIQILEADRIIQSTYEALGDKNIVVKNLDNGVFKITGKTITGSNIHQRVVDLKNDFPDHLVHFVDNIQDIDPRQMTPKDYDAAFEDKNIYYVETPDGTKHFNLSATVSE